MPAVIQSTRDTRLEEALSYSLGGGDGILRNYGDAGAVTAQAPVSMQVDVGSCAAWFSNQFYTMPAGESGAGEIAAPTGGGAGDYRRIDLIVWTLGTGIVVVTGVESGTPVAPATPSNSVLLAQVRCRTGMTSVKDTDDSSNGWIVDARSFL